MPGTISNTIIAEAKKLYDELFIEELFTTESTDNLEPLYQITQGKLISPDDWALVQESCLPAHRYAQFFARYRQDISSQYMSHGKKCTAVPIITFTHENEPYVLLMENKGLAHSAEVGCVQWTAHGVRVDANEKDKVSPERWHLYEQISGDEDNTYFIAAAVRRVREMGIELSDDRIKQIYGVNRDAAGYPETSKNYRTEYLNIDLGEIPEAKIRHLLAQSSTRFAQWTQVFKLKDLHASIKPATVSELSQAEEYTLNYDGKILPIRTTSWFFLVALQLAKEMELKPEGLIKDPWQLRNIRTIELAFNWLIKWTDKASNGGVQITLMDERNNRLSPSKIQVYAALAGLYDETLARDALKPQRLILHFLIAHLTVSCKFDGALELEKIIDRLYPAFFAQHPGLEQQWEEDFTQMEQNLSTLIKDHLYSDETLLSTLNSSEREDINCVKKLLDTIQKSQLTPLQQNLYHLTETAQEIAIIIRLHQKYHESIQSHLLPVVGEFIAHEIDLGNLFSLTTHPLNEHLTFGISGPVASGKSTSEEFVRILLKGQDAAFISSDEWNVILSAFLNLDPVHYAMPRGILSLAEAWGIKEIIFHLLNEMMTTQEKVPHWIQEACDTSAIRTQAYGHNFVFANTADPNEAGLRVKVRGDKTGRYVSASYATGSYLYSWPNLLKSLHKFDLTNTTVSIIDTDVMYAPENQHFGRMKCLELAKIAVVEKQQIHIHDLSRFIQLIERSYRINPNPKNPHPDEIWLKDQPVEADKTGNEFKKLFKFPALTVHFKRQELSETDVDALVASHYSIPIQSKATVFASSGGFFSGGLAASSKPPSEPLNQFTL